MKNTLKKTFRLFFGVLALPFSAVHMLVSRVDTSDRIFQGISQLFSLMPGTVGEYMRSAFYTQVCSSVHPTTSIGFLTILSHANTTIDENVYIGAQGNIGMCTIGKNCLIGSGVHILSGKSQHSFSDPNIPIKDQSGVYEKLTIGEDSWFGNCAVVMAPVGKRCVVAAGAVVTKPVDDFVIVGGNPAKPIGSTI